jgi:hypothetical protein
MVCNDSSARQQPQGTLKEAKLLMKIQAGIARTGREETGAGGRLTLRIREMQAVCAECHGLWLLTADWCIGRRTKGHGLVPDHSLFRAGRMCCAHA